MKANLQPSAAPRVVLLFGVFLLAAVGASHSVHAEQDEDSERVPSSAGQIYSPIQRTFDRQPVLPGGPRGGVPDASLPRDDGPVLWQDLKERLRYADPFFRDMKVAVYLRTHDLDRDNALGAPSDAWAGGTALGLLTGFHDGWLQFEAAAATSQPIFAPEGEGGTLLLTDNQAEVSAMALANVRLRGFGQDLVVGRQLIKTPYINPQDNRMIPNAFEGVTLMRRRDEVQALDYGVGYLWGFKARDSSYFVPFSQPLGVEEDRGVLVGGAKVMPAKGLTVGAVDYLMADVVNTAFAEVDWIVDVAPMQLRFSANYTDQRSAGADLAGEPFATDQVSARFAASYDSATLLIAASQNGKGAALRGPFGSFPAYTVLDQLNFNEAGQETIVVGAAYDLSHLVLDGLKAQTRYGWAWGAVDAESGAPLTRQNEFNVELEYLPTSGPLKNIYVQLFYSAVEFPNNPPGETQQPQARGVITYLIPLL
ncbi:MAG: OprD family outer membrane porin [Hyphomicrobium sp.]|jgi:hypothetical protein